eukprot:COSAG05_NODE_3064_length_2365_cov_13.284201_2_plen_393_part_00
MACVLPALPENTLWAEVDPPGCAAPPCCGEGLELSADVTCVISCQEGFNQDDGGTYEYTCTGGVLQGPSPICTEASPFFVLVIFGVVSGGVWIFMAYATFVQGQKLVHERRFSAADTPETRARRKSSLRATGSLDKRVAGNVCAWLTRPGGCCVPDEPEDTRMYSAIGIVENRSWCQRFCAKLGGCFGLFDSCRAFKQWHVTQIGIYGGKFVFFQIAVNFVYGVSTSFWFFFLVYYLDDDLRLQPAAALSLQGTLNIAPIFKPLCGLITDNFKLCGSNRRHYFCMTALVASLCYLFLFLYPGRLGGSGQPSVALATIALFGANLFGYSWSGVVLYSMTAEKARLDPVAGAANLNTLQWGWFALGNLAADINVGWMYAPLRSSILNRNTGPCG